MYQVIIVIHVLLGLGVIGLVLMQQGKGADAGAAFGSGASGTVFGAQGSASFLSRATAVLATLFFLTSLTLAVLSGGKSGITDLFDQEDSELSEIPMTIETDETPLNIPSVEDVPPVVDTQPTAPVISEEAPVTQE